MKHPFKPFTIAITGDFGEARTHDKIKQWVEANGGTFTTKISAEVTHLICSREHYKKPVAMVQQARKVKDLKIISFDWLEDSLMRSTRKPTGPYLMSRQVKVAAKAKAVKKEKKTVRKENVQKGSVFEKSCREFQDDMHSDGYHIYRDRTNFLYSIVLARIDLLTNKNERYSLKLHETHSLPHLYSTHVKYYTHGTSATQVLAPIGSTFETAMTAFKKFFEVKTRKAWEDRKMWGSVEGCFVYTAPGSGEPAGETLEDVERKGLTSVYGGPAGRFVKASKESLGLPGIRVTSTPSESSALPTRRMTTVQDTSSNPSPSERATATSTPPVQPSRQTLTPLTTSTLPPTYVSITEPVAALPTPLHVPDQSDTNDHNLVQTTQQSTHAAPTHTSHGGDIFAQLMAAGREMAKVVEASPSSWT